MFYWISAKTILKYVGVYTDPPEAAPLSHKGWRAANRSFSGDEQYGKDQFIEDMNNWKPRRGK